jgi:hypothetical protein
VTIFVVAQGLRRSVFATISPVSAKVAATAREFVGAQRVPADEGA